MKPYKVTVEPLLKDEHKFQRKKCANWARNKFRKEDTVTILFSDKTVFDLDGIYNGENDCIWAVNRKEPNRRGEKKARKVCRKVIVWLAICLEGIAPLVLFEKGTLDYHRYIKEVLPVGLRYGNSKFGNK